MFIRKISITIFSLLLLSAMATGTASAKSNETINYVALGDSLAEGQMPTELGLGYYNVDRSYADIISEKLAGEGEVNYNNYGMSGYTISTVFDTANPTEIQKADIITLDIGANDLLRLVSMDEATLSGLKETDLAALLASKNYQSDIVPILQFIRSQIPRITSGVAQNILAIRDMEDMAEKPYAQIYVMGYYNAFSFLADLELIDPTDPNIISLLQAGLDDLIQDYNSSLQTELSSMEGVTYVDSYDRMDNHLEKFLPIDIHPTIQGYQAIAQAFWKEIVPAIVSE